MRSYELNEAKRKGKYEPLYTGRRGLSYVWRKVFVEKGYCLSYTLFRKLGRFPSQMASNNDCDAYHETQLLYRIGPKIVEMWRTMEQCGEKVLARGPKLLAELTAKLRYLRSPKFGSRSCRVTKIPLLNSTDLLKMVSYYLKPSETLTDVS